MSMTMTMIVNTALDVAAVTAVLMLAVWAIRDGRPPNARFRRRSRIQKQMG
jgi:hypothetical protein